MTNNTKKQIYLDYAASTPVDPKVLQAMLPYFSKEYGNASSIHGFGQRALAAIDEAREKVAEFLSCDSREIIFTGSATEANNLALQGIIKATKQESNETIKRYHIITSQIEHDSILETCRMLEKEGIEVTYLPVTKDGFVRPEDVKDALKENTVLVSIMYANNEIGTIQPIAEIGRLLKSYNLNLKFKVYFHTDAVQAVNYLDCNVNNLGVDMLTISGHKIYGPKGVGTLYIRKSTPIKPLIYGGGQERGLRSGTENIAGIVGLGVATAQIRDLRLKIKETEKLQAELIDGVLKTIPGAKLNASRENRLPNNANFYFPGIDAQSLIIALNQEGIAVSSGSACSTRAVQPSHVLLAIGLSKEAALSSIRVTIGRYTTLAEIRAFLKILPKVIKRIKRFS